MLPGFLPFSRASLAVDVVALTTLAVVPLLAWSIYLVKYEKNYALHRKIQLTLAGLVLGAVVLFELEVRIYGWRQFAEPSPFYDTILFPVLYVHLFFAISTPLLWIYTILGAVRRFPKPPRPNEYSPRHRRVARLAAAGMLCTAFTSWIFYYLAFVA